MAAMFRIMLAMEVHEPEAVLQGVQVPACISPAVHWQASLCVMIGTRDACIWTSSAGCVSDCLHIICDAACP